MNPTEEALAISAQTWVQMKEAIDENLMAEYEIGSEESPASVKDLPPQVERAWAEVMMGMDKLGRALIEAGQDFHD